VCSFDGDARTGLRVLSGGKNRFGPEGEVAWFEMGGTGVQEVDPAAALASSGGEAGAATALVAAGRRGLALEVQALAVPTQGPPRRNVSGLDPRRFGLVAAVVDRAAGLQLGRSELYGAVAGGLRVDDPGADLAVAVSLVSTSSGTPPPRGAAFCGELSLTGAVRPVAGLAARLQAAAAARIDTVFCPPGATAPPGIRLVPVRRVSDALRWSRSGRSRNIRTPARPGEGESSRNAP
jgi:DNA repair protein RadA/Sms